MKPLELPPNCTLETFCDIFAKRFPAHATYTFPALYHVRWLAPPVLDLLAEAVHLSNSYEPNDWVTSREVDYVNQWWQRLADTEEATREILRAVETYRRENQGASITPFDLDPCLHLTQGTADAACNALCSIINALVVVDEVHGEMGVDFGSLFAESDARPLLTVSHLALTPSRLKDLLCPNTTENTKRFIDACIEYEKSLTSPCVIFATARPKNKTDTATYFVEL